MSKKYKRLKQGELYRVRTEQLGNEYVVAESLEEAIQKVERYSRQLTEDFSEGEKVVYSDQINSAERLGRLVF